MSASFALPEQVDGLEKLLALASLKKEDIAAAAEESRKQLQLTQAEQGKLAEAKSYIAQHASLSANIKSREDTLALGISNLEEEKRKHAEHVDSENKRLETLALGLGVREKAIVDSERVYAQNIAALNDEKAAHARAHQEAMSNVKIAENANIEIGRALKTEEQRLKDWEATLKRKAELARQQMANF